MTDNRNTILAVILSGLVLIAWQYFYNMPQMEKRRAAEQAQSELVKPAQPGGHRRHAARRRGSDAVGRCQCARHQPACFDGTGRQPRGRDSRLPARQDRHPARHRQHCA